MGIISTISSLGLVETDDFDFAKKIRIANSLSFWNLASIIPYIICFIIFISLEFSFSLIVAACIFFLSLVFAKKRLFNLSRLITPIGNAIPITYCAVKYGRELDGSYLFFAMLAYAFIVFTTKEKYQKFILIAAIIVWYSFVFLFTSTTSDAPLLTEFQARIINLSVGLLSASMLIWAFSYLEKLNNGLKSQLSNTIKNLDLSLEKKGEEIEILKIKDEQERGKSVKLNTGDTLFLNNVLFIQSNDNYILIYLNNKKTPIIERRVLREFVKGLPNNFIQIHRSFCINKYHIKCRPSKYSIILSNGDELKVTKSYINNLDD